MIAESKITGHNMNHPESNNSTLHLKTNIKSVTITCSNLKNKI